MEIMGEKSASSIAMWLLYASVTGCSRTNQTMIYFLLVAFLYGLSKLLIFVLLMKKLVSGYWNSCNFILMASSVCTEKKQKLTYNAE